MTRPTPAELLEIARATLLSEVAAKLDGDARFKLLMAANAMAIAQRALTLGEGEAAAAEAALGDAASLCAAIRGGVRDGDTVLAGRLLALAEARCRVSAPKAI
jgi:hypothetical protein